MAWPGERGEAGVAVVRPTRLLITGSAVRVEMRASPPTEKSRAVGRVNRRAKVSSGSVLGGVEGLARSAVQDDVELVGGRGRSRRRQEIGREAQRLGRRRNPRDIDFGEAHRALALVALADARTGGVNGHGQGAEGGAREGDHLARDHPRLVRQGHVHVPVAVEGKGDPLDIAVGLPRLGLQQRDVVGGDRMGQLDVQALVGGGTEGTLGPGRVGVAVDGLERAVLRRVGDRIAVGRGPHRGHLAYLGHRLVGAPGAGEYRHGHLGGIGHERLLARRLHVAVVVVQGAPGRELLAIAVGEHEDGAPGQLALQGGRALG